MEPPQKRLRLLDNLTVDDADTGTDTSNVLSLPDELLDVVADNTTEDMTDELLLHQRVGADRVRLSLTNKSRQSNRTRWLETNLKSTFPQTYNAMLAVKPMLIASWYTTLERLYARVLVYAVSQPAVYGPSARAFHSDVAGGGSKPATSTWPSCWLRSAIRL
jgi:hypothetical protein